MCVCIVDDVHQNKALRSTIYATVGVSIVNQHADFTLPSQLLGIPLLSLTDSLGMTHLNYGGGTHRMLRHRQVWRRNTQHGCRIEEDSRHCSTGVHPRRAKSTCEPAGLTEVFP